MIIFYSGPSEIHGVGCFVDAWLPAGSCLRLFADKWVDDEYAIESTGGSYYVFDGPYCFINHSDDPNCEITEEKGRFYLEVIQDLEPGDEITFNYEGDE